MPVAGADVWCRWWGGGCGAGAGAGAGAAGAGAGWVWARTGEMLLPPPPPLLRLIPRGPIPPREDGAARRRPGRPPCPACVPCGRWAVNVMSLIMMALLGEYLCMRRELQDIPLFGSSARRKPTDSSF